MPERTEFAVLREKAKLSVDAAARLIGKSPRTVHRYEFPGKSGTVPPYLVIEALKRAVNDRCSRTGDQNTVFQFADLFAGIGGMRIPFEEIGGKCVFTSEWDRFARQTYAANFVDGENHSFAGDIRPIAAEPDRIPEHDVLLAGFPCQPFSIAGVSKKNSLGKPHGFLCDTQGTLFHDLAKILEHHQPPVFLLENVKHLQRHDGGRTFGTIMNVLEKELGYDVHAQVICSSPWVPQKRERIFIVGFRSPTPFSFDDLGMPEGKPPVIGEILDPEVDPKYTLTEHLWRYLQSYKERHRKAGNGFGYSLFGPEDVARTLSARYYKDGSEILLQQEGGRPRRLTPRECARLMGFDEPGRPEFRIPVSDTQAYRQFGNAVVVPLVRAIATLLKPHILVMLAKHRGIAVQTELPLV